MILAKKALFTIVMLFYYMYVYCGVCVSEQLLSNINII